MVIKITRASNEPPNMTDSDRYSDAWIERPSDYFERRPPMFTCPATPRSHYLHMPDGCRLAIDLFLPCTQGEQTAPGTFPTLVIFTPYNRRFDLKQPGAEPSPNTAIYRDMFVPRGYALVVVDVRGTGASFGTRDSMRSPRERDDSYEVAQWVSSQHWCNGAIGSTGISYLGAAACFFASTGHPAIKAIAPLFGISDLYSEQLYPGGMLSRVWVEAYDDLMAALDHANRGLASRFAYFNDPSFNGPAPVDDDADAVALNAALVAHRDNFRLKELAPELLYREKPLSYDENIDSSSFSPYRYVDLIPPDVAVYSVSGWYDGAGYANGAISRFLSLPNRDKHLLLGPWDHGARTNISPWRDRAAATFCMYGELLRFFDRHLLGVHDDAPREAPIHYYSVHDDNWHSAQVWPPEHAIEKLWLDDSEQLCWTPPNETPSGVKPTRDIQVRFDWSSGQNTRYERLGAKSVDHYYADWKEREQLLAGFSTAPLTRDLPLVGHVVANIHLAASQSDCALFLYLSEITEDGEVYYITEALIRARHRKVVASPHNYTTTWPFQSFHEEDAENLTPGKSDWIRFAFLPIAWTLKAGSRLRLSIAGADQEHFPQVPPGRPPRLSITLGGEHGSHIAIPVATRNEKAP